ncbi:MAG: heme-copper oxidase subunit III [Candidatus Binatus sp.]|uniref:cytochrome c oxidase subunit 3 n=1 Tax=Candidatus Binatus sp. TaxID=2811406 RepID=UPI002727BC2F|nr:heme-copper oxidase subunit III [Candidatus Binatus sp.]MDO8432850.1 heme-copper oxidase subunit III [Candidatus Binatus sp.]
MSEVAAIETHGRETLQIDQFEPSLTPDNSGKLGMWIFLAADAMTFGAAIAAYGALRIGNPNWPSPAEYLGITTTAVMTFILICSSVTMVEALSGIQHGNMSKFKNFMALTVLGGVIFLGMQAFEWHHLLGEKGMSIKRDLFDATFFILTGFHGCHVFGGVVYNSVLLIRGATGKLTPAKSGLVEIAGLYWHFVDLVWILIFTFIYLI